MQDFRIDSKSVLSCFGKLQYGTNEETSESRRAFRHGDILTFTLNLPRQLGAIGATIAIRADKDGEVVREPMIWCGIHEDDDIWCCDFNTQKNQIGLHYLRAEVETVAGKAITVGHPKGCRFVQYNDSDYHFQLLLSAFAYEQPEWLLGGTIYQVFVDRFSKGAQMPVRQDAILNPDWENGIPQYPEYPGAPLENNMFFGGSLDGVTKKLPYLSKLGVTCIYLTPIFRAYSNHKYDTGNYMEVDEMFGGEAALKELIAASKEYGIRIVLDGVFNHTGDDSLYFNKKGKYDSLGAYQSKQSPYYQWYHFQRHPDKYTAWWGIGILPRINADVPSCRDYFLGAGGVIEHYAKMGIGGFRLDVADELSDDFIAGIKQVLSKTSPGSVLYGEVWEDASNKISYDKRRRYFWGDELDGVMNYEIRKGIIEFLRDGKSAALRYALCDVMANTPKRVQDIQMNLIGTHDTTRILTELAGKPADALSNQEKSVYKLSKEDRVKGIQKQKCAYLIAATVPGVPMIYYGDEVGMEGYNDPFNRMPFAWHNMDEDLLSFYQAIGDLRKTQSVYRDGTFVLHKLDDECIAFSRTKDGVSLVTVVNAGNKKRQLLITPNTEVVLGKEAKDNSIWMLPYDCVVVKADKADVDIMTLL